MRKSFSVTWLLTLITLISLLLLGALLVLLCTLFCFTRANAGEGKGAKTVPLNSRRQTSKEKVLQERRLSFPPK